ncbi:hypothetical protein [Cecembia sp.]|uniref:hypothetical protein n=1 Tax=Cecembia sp. TaxID=1898110 RepID=UPI0025C334F0|nr:hypothetical protein [Cecembia sp.]
MQTTPSKNTIPKWLKRVQENSWEPEILLSGLVLIGLLQLPEKIRFLSNYMRSEALSGNLSGVFTGMEQVVYVLILGLLVHLFLRSVWVGLIGLTYTFPKGIQAEKLGYQPQFERKVKSLSSLENQIILLEKICSSIFATCFFLIMLIIGIMASVIIFVAFVFLLAHLLESLGISGAYWMDLNLDLIITIIFMVLVLDFIGLGIYRKNKYLAKIYYPIHRFIGWITFSKFYRSIYYVFASNLRKGYLIGFFVLFIVFSFIGQNRMQQAPDESAFSFIKFYSRSPGTTLFSGNFEDRNQNWSSYLLEIPSPIVSGRFLELRVKHQKILENKMMEVCGLKPEDLKDSNEQANQNKLDCMNAVYAIFLDGEKVENPDWLFYFHQDEKRKGLITFVDIGNLALGRHYLEVKVNTSTPAYSLGTIPFMKE